MGNEASNSKKSNKNIDKSKLEISLKQIFFTAQLNKDRRKGAQNTKEKELLALIREPTNKRSKDNEYSKASAIVNDIKSIKAHECIMRYSDILKDSSMVIQLSQGDTSKIEDLIPYCQSLIWGCQKCNIDCIKTFEEFIFNNFGKDALASIHQFTKVTSELKDQFHSILPTEREVKLYLIDFCNRQGISLETMNEAGHSLSPTELADLPEPTPSSSNNQSNQGSQGSQQGGSQPFYPGGPGGFQQGGNFPQGGGNFQQGGSNYPQQVYSGGNYPPNNYQPYPQYPPQNYQPNSFPNSYPSFGGYPQPNSQQGGFPQQPYPSYPQQQQQPNYSQQQQQPNYSQQQPNYSQQQQQPNFQQQPSFQQQQQPQPSNPNSQIPKSTGPSQGGQQQSSQPQPQPTQQSQPNPTSSIDDSSPYPTFQKFTDAPSTGKGGSDPLDELEQRLKNIKGGL